MLETQFKNKITWGFVILLVLLLVLIRWFESQLFYDPFIDYFKNEFEHQSYPDYNFMKLFVNLKIRYILNSVITLAILYQLFKDKAIIKIASILLFLFLVVLMIAMLILLTLFDENQAVALFYVRRFLIQPLFLILFIPAFYYQMKKS